MQTEHLKVTGMTCGGCTSAVTKALEAVSGVSDVRVSLVEGEVTVQYDESRSSLDQIKTAIKEAGYGVDVPLEAYRHQSKGGCCS
ncbi:copper chaperone [Undibacterium sp. YM2]|uniref:heavy-metal-associated domain-containing protein n=1 Tax=Undibacterium sp. YM2 TaxID=2058625 RepID=UPI001331E9DB|nr:copper chaperone [Undibacterium sp. YM2]